MRKLSRKGQVPTLSLIHISKALRPYVEKLITLAKRGDVHSRRLATATIHNTTAVKRLFDEIAPCLLYTSLFAGNKADVGLPPLAAAQQPDQSGAEKSGAKGEVSAEPHA